MRPLLLILAAVLCVGVGVYPLRYLVEDGDVGLLQLKSESLRSDGAWRAAFYLHVVGGGIALAAGWTQFLPAWRARSPRRHRNVGKLYVLAVCLSGASGVYLAYFASTGAVAGLGFGSLGVVWLYSTVEAYRSARRRDLRRHERLMIYSYAASCAAVTLRLWLPFLLGVLRLDFSVAYPIVAWLCWAPNLLVARGIVARSRKRLRGEESAAGES